MRSHDVEFELGLKKFSCAGKHFNPSSNSASRPRRLNALSATCRLAIHLARDQHGRGFPRTPRHTPTSPVTNAGEVYLAHSAFTSHTLLHTHLACDQCGRGLPRTLRYTPTSPMTNAGKVYLSHPATHPPRP